MAPWLLPAGSGSADGPTEGSGYFCGFVKPEPTRTAIVCYQTYSKLIAQWVATNAGGYRTSRNYIG